MYSFLPKKPGDYAARLALIGNSTRAYYALTKPVKVPAQNEVPPPPPVRSNSNEP